MSRYYNGSSHTKITGHSIPTGSNARFISCWVKSVDVTVRQFFLSQQPDNGRFALEIRGGSPSYFAVNWFGGAILGTVIAAANDTWFHVMASRGSGGGIDLFVNATADGTSGGAGFSATGTDLYIGALNATPTLPLTGEVDDIVCGVSAGSPYSGEWAAALYAGIPPIKFMDTAGQRCVTWMPVDNDFVDYRLNGATIVTDGSTEGSGRPTARCRMRPAIAKPRRGF